MNFNNQKSIDETIDSIDFDRLRIIQNTNYLSQFPNELYTENHDKVLAIPYNNSTFCSDILPVTSMKMRPKRLSAAETEPIEEIFGSSGQVKSPPKPKSRRSSIQSLQNTFHTTFSSLKIRRR